MHARVKKKMSILAVFLLSGVCAASAIAAPPAPWFPPGGMLQAPQGQPNPGPRDAARQRTLYSEQRFIRHIYQGFLNRQPSSYEMRLWGERLGRGRQSDGVWSGSSWTPTSSSSAQTYRGLLGREPDTSGMDTYLRVLQERPEPGRRGRGAPRVGGIPQSTAVAGRAGLRRDPSSAGGDEPLPSAYLAPGICLSSLLAGLTEPAARPASRRRPRSRRRRCSARRSAGRAGR